MVKSIRWFNFGPGAILLLGLVLVPKLALGQLILDCFDCTLGLYDDPGMTRTSGTLTPGEPKDLWLGIRFADFFHGTTGIEFSIAGLHGETGEILVLAVQPLVPTSIVLGSPASPPDTSATTTGTGGMNIAWPTCLGGDQALLRLTVLALDPIRDRVLRVVRKYPTSNRNWRTPIFVWCDDPVYTSVRTTGNCYGLNLGGPLECPRQPGNHLPVCDAGGPYHAVCEGQYTTLQVSALGSSDPDPGDVLYYNWSSDCPGAGFSDYDSPTPTLTLYTGGCAETPCPITVNVGDGRASSQCTTTVEIVTPVNLTPSSWSGMKSLYR